MPLAALGGFRYPIRVGEILLQRCYPGEATRCCTYLYIAHILFLWDTILHSPRSRSFWAPPTCCTLAAYLVSITWSNEATPPYALSCPSPVFGVTTCTICYHCDRGSGMALSSSFQACV